MRKKSPKSFPLLCLPALLFGIFSCHKQKATLTLEGTWNVVGAEGGFISSCEAYVFKLNVKDSLLGTLTFKEEEVVRDYELFVDKDGCYDHTYINDTQEWRVMDHERYRVAAHRYVLQIGNEEWSAVFGEDRTGEPASEQDFLYLARIGEGSSLLYLELERVM
jgi:hypothetical protein